MLTREDLDALPDDGHRHELLDGAIFVTPSPGFSHQDVVLRLGSWMLPAIDAAGLVLLGAPFDVVLSEFTVVEPDLLVARRDQFSAKDLAGAPLLAVEVRSRSTAAVDAVIKRDLYERAGVQSYWLIDPAGPSLTVLELVDGRYQEVATVGGDESIEVTQPVPMRLTPSQWRGSRPRP
jgi:Uma2 family endonuclease